MDRAFYSKGLSDVIRAQIRDLDRVCGKNEPLCMKLNWDMLEVRPADEVNDLLWYVDGQLAAFLGLYGFGAQPEEIEITGMVHPDFRRQGIFTKLFREAVSICRSRGAGRLLLIAERQSLSGAAFARNAGLTYDFSEYRMICNGYSPPRARTGGLSLRPAADRDTAFLMKLDAACFGSTFPGGYGRELTHIYVAALDGRDIGKIGLCDENGLGYVFGVCILPEFQGRGYGRAMLDAILQKHFDASGAAAILEVAVKNGGALSLYKACGFSELTIYDYFELKL
ncbi:GNAT family N-acetyltransferase [Sporobacter termitidis]|uniref:GNAT family N-acetyltransferase n=1 Tax=Sporobacter termitidis TaxID=44749 RepID=UPI000932BF0D|nr:GNAT family N-acetyltransferase [Sporobacter termitidis]